MEEFSRSILTNSRIITPQPVSVLIPAATTTETIVTQPSSNLPSRVEQAILSSTAPIPLPDSEVIEANGYRGIWANKDEVVSWSGPVPLSQYRISNDPNPEVIRKQSNQPVEYNQDISIRYLRPPTPVGGDVIIRKEDQVIPVAAPPVILRVPGERPPSPPEVILREAPPDYPRFPTREIVVPGKTVSEQIDRKLIIEKLPPTPQKPPSIVIEKWLPPTKLKRRIRFEGATTRSSVYPRQRNLIVSWDAPPTIIKKGIRYLGVVSMNPEEYRARYGATLRHPSEMPKFVLDHERIATLGEGPVKYSQDLPDIDLSIPYNSYRSERYYTTTAYPTTTTTSTVVSPAQVELFGDLHALSLLDDATLEREGLLQYKQVNDTKRTITEVSQYF